MVSAFNPFASLGIEFYGFLLPWLFAFAIVYGLLSKVELFGGASKKVNAILALVVAFFVTAVGGTQLALFFTALSATTTVFLAGILVIVLLMAMGGHSEKVKNGIGGTWGVAFLVLVGVGIFLASTGGFLGVSLDQNTATLIFWLIIIVAIIYFIAFKEEGKTST